MSSNFSPLLKQFGESVGLPDLEFDGDGYACLSFDDLFVNMEIIQDGQALFLYARLGEIQEAYRTIVFETVMNANFFFKETAGGTLAVAKGSDDLVLQHRLPWSEAGEGGFDTLLENFIRVAESWQNRLMDIQRGEGETGSEESNGKAIDYFQGLKA